MSKVLTVYPFDLLYLTSFKSQKSVLMDFPSNPDFSQPHDLEVALVSESADCSLFFMNI